MRSRRFYRAALGGVLMSLGLVAMAPSAKAESIDLGSAGNYAVFALNSFQYNGPGNITGDVAVGGSTNFSGPATINGTVFLNTGVAQQGNITPSGGFTTTDLSGAISAAKSAASTFAGLTPTQTLGTLGNNSSITGNGGFNVVNTSGINMSNGVLTISGSANDIFLVNVNGQFTSSNSDISLSGGVTANHILFNVSGNVAITGGGPTNFYGTILAPNSDIAVHDKQLTGELIGNTIEDTSGFQVTGTRSVPGPSPMAASAILMLVLGLGYVAKARFAKTA